LPICFESFSEVMPLTMVQKTIGAIIIFTSLTKPSPSGLSAAPNSGHQWPTAMPSTSPIRTWT
jgi:hypothetical protein